METNFKSSINVKFDIGKEDIFISYVPTKSHINPFEAVLSSYTSTTNKNSILVIGPYGTGKSHLSSILCSITSKNYTKPGISSFASRLEHFDEYNQAAKLVRKSIREVTSYIPILLNGNEGNFREVILSKLIGELKSRNIVIQLPDIASSILKTIDRWESDFPSTYKSFTKLIKNVENFKSKIENGDRETAASFYSIYESLSAGATFTPIDINKNFISNLRNLLKVLGEMNLGVIINYDEFGRFIQTVNKEDIHSTMQDIQDLAELANNECHNLLLLFITHRSLSSYIHNYSQELREEFSRIEGRFSVYSITSDESVFASLIEARLRESLGNKLPPSEYITSNLNELRNYNIFNTLSPQMLENRIISGCFPLMPVTLFLLSALSNMFGQNERTLFTFLDNNIEHGLFNKLKTNKIIYPYHLFDFFFQNNENIGVKEKNALTQLELLKASNCSLEVINIYTFALLWEFCELNDKDKLSENFISYSCGISLKTTQESVKFLLDNKYIRFNRRISRIELIEGSALNIYELIQNESLSLEIDDNSIIDESKNALDFLFVKSDDYNQKFKMIRFAQVHLYIIDSDGFNFESLSSSDSDFNIHYFITKDQSESIDLSKKMNNLVLTRDLFCITEIDYKSILSIVRKIIATKMLLNRSDIVSYDKFVANELTNYLDEFYFELENILAPISAFSKKNIWKYTNAKCFINNYLELSNFISDRMVDLFPQSPIIQHDLFNKRIITPSQKTAAIKLISLILEGQKPTGNGPDLAIYHSVFVKNNHLPFEGANNNQSSLLNIKTYLLKKISNTKSLYDIVDSLTSSPFGIRKPLIPILFVGLLIDVWENLLFYGDNSYINDLSPENLYLMLTEPNDISVIYQSYNKKQIKCIHFLLDNFRNSSTLKEIQHIKACRSIYQWLISLPKFTQLTLSFDKSVINFRDIINQFTIDPLLTLDNLVEIGETQIISNKVILDSFIVNKNQEIIDWLLSQFQADSYNQLKQIIEDYGQKNVATNLLLKIIMSSFEDNLIDNLSIALLGITLADWTDKIEDVFKSEIEQLISKIGDSKLVMEKLHVIEIDGSVYTISKSKKNSISAENIKLRLLSILEAQNARLSDEEKRKIILDIFITLNERK